MEPTATPQPSYLGDGLYATYDGYQVEVFAHNGLDKTNRVYLDRETLTSFLDWVRRHVAT